MTALLLLRRLWPILWPILAALAVIGAAWTWGNSREADGRSVERASWQLARAELLELRRRKADWSAADLAAKIDRIPTAATKEIIRVETHWRDRPVRECFDAGLVQSLEKARAAVRRSAATGSSGDTVRVGSTAAIAGDGQGDGKVGH